ncbi:MAG: c-type cytochrome [Bryobacteraceae bacterium]
MVKKILIAVLVLVVVALGGGFSYLHLRQPAMAPPRAGSVPMTPERIARGKLLFERIADCDGCHSERDFTRFGLPVVPTGRGRGWEFPPEMGLPGRVVAANITPDKETGIGQWTDGEKIRAIREGVSRDGRALFPMMPYTMYRSMSDADVEAVVAYMNTLKPVRNQLPRTELTFPVNLFIKGVPQPAASVPPVDGSDRLKYGEYLTTIGGCFECHTQAEKGEPARGMLLAGGRAFSMGRGTVVSANITPHPETGIGRWSEQQFLEKFYEYKEYAEKGSPVVGPESFTVMPWLSLSQLPPEDLGAIYTFLKTQPAVKNAVETHPGQQRSSPD